MKLLLIPGNIGATSSMGCRCACKIKTARGRVTSSQLHCLDYSVVFRSWEVVLCRGMHDSTVNLGASC